VKFQASRTKERLTSGVGNEAPASAGAQTTALLIALLVVGAAASLWAFVRLQGAREAATAASRDLVECRADLADLAKWQGGRTTIAPLDAKDPELNRRLSAAAVAAGISGELASIEPGQPARVKDTDYTETPVFLRFGAVTLRELAGFLSDLSAGDAAVRTKTIELSVPAPDAAGHRPGELWTSDVALGYLTYAPRGREAR